eukprot:Clim_evm4s103 gene=Clim_evmTU4s103
MVLSTAAFRNLKGSSFPIRAAAVSVSTRAASTARVVVIGGGAGGQAVAHQVLNRVKDVSMTIIEPHGLHYYQPGWTMVGGGILAREATARRMQECMPEKAKWVKDAVSELDPDNNRVKLADSGGYVDYDFLVVAPGLTIQWDTIKGLEDALEDREHPVSSNYSFMYCSKTARLIDHFSGGKAVFTQPSCPIKCAGAPQKIMYLAEAKWSDKGIRSNAHIHFYTGMPTNFSAPVYAAKLREICKEKNCNIHTLHNLKEVRKGSKEAVFSKLKDGKEIGDEVVKYDLMHVTPTMMTPAFLKNSPLAAAMGGFCEVNKETLQHVRYENVFSLGDASSLPTSKTAAAISGECKVLVENLLKAMDGQQASAIYDGYTACPIPVGHEKVLLAEFDYTLSPKPSFPMDPTKEREFYFYLKRDLMPALYWNQLIRGTWLGPSTMPFGFLKNQFGFY